MVSVRIWIDRRRIITTRRRRLLSVQDVRASIDQGQGPRTAGEFLVMLTERLALRIGNVVTEIEEAIEDIEDRVATHNVRDLQNEIVMLRRQTAAMRRYLSPQREALTRVRGRTAVLSDHELYELEEHTDLTTRYLEDLDLAREQAMMTQEQLASRLASEQNSRLYVLSIVAAVFLPLSFVTGLLGMNVGGLPGIDYAPAFAISVVTMVGVALGLIAFFKWKKWI
jgi:zinc transporter